LVWHRTLLEIVIASSGIRLRRSSRTCNCSAYLNALTDWSKRTEPLCSLSVSIYSSPFTLLKHIEPLLLGEALRVYVPLRVGTFARSNNWTPCAWISTSSPLHPFLSPTWSYNHALGHRPPAGHSQQHSPWQHHPHLRPTIHQPCIVVVRTFHALGYKQFILVFNLGLHRMRRVRSVTITRPHGFREQG
jgi:hypothetical protein